MADYHKQIEHLQLKLEDLFRKQEYFSAEINDLKLKIDSLRDLIKAEGSSDKSIVEVQAAPVVDKSAVEMPAQPQPPVQPRPQPKPQPVRKPVSKENSSAGLEKYIGQNLIPVIGIIITVIGVGIGAKYAIDHKLITPLTRILLGYLMGGGLLFFALKLKEKYHEFSAILLSGSMAILYFITFFAYDFYSLIPLAVVFPIMVAITGFTVYSAIKYNLQLIAHIGLIGAYAVPLLLSDGSGRIGIFFSYVALINIGILVVSFFRNWKSLYYVSFGLTWFIYIIWSTALYQKENFTIALVFLVIFFLIFYVTNLAYKLIKKEVFSEVDGIMIILNSTIFFLLGIFILLVNTGTSKYISWFTLFNALIHFSVAAFMHFRKPEDRKLFFLSTGLGLVFLTVFIPIQIDQDWLTLLWILEAGLLFWIGRTQSGRIYEIFSYPVLILAFISLWINYLVSNDSHVFLNINFLTSAVFAGVLIFIQKLFKNEKYIGAYQNNVGMKYITESLVYVLLLAIAFFSIQIEINAFWQNRYQQSVDYALNLDNFKEKGNSILKSMQAVSNILYTLIFVSVLAYLKRRTKNTEEFNVMFLMAFLFTIFFFLTIGLYQLNSLHLKYLYSPENSIYYHGFWLVGIRYISFGVISLAIFQLIRFLKVQMPSRSMTVVSEYILHTVIVWCGSAELVNWVHSFHSDQAYKLVLSIFAGLYALFLIVLGIWKKKSYLRIGAISLFGATLLKLFFYDIAKMDTIFKTVVFISLGILLLIISFLYNKYKGRMFEEQQ